MTNAEAPAWIAGIILAGGRSSRMGRDKALIELGGAPVIAHVADRLRPQVARLAINVNGGPARFAFLDAPALPDAVGAPGEEGPLAGIVTGLQWASAGGFAQAVFAPSDAPFLPNDLVARLAEGGAEAISIAESERGVEPLFSLWPAAFCALAEKAFAESERSPQRLIRMLPHRFVRFEAAPGQPDPFFNLNTPSDVTAAETWIVSASRSPG